jgi:class 3 adenylate cyclase
VRHETRYARSGDLHIAYQAFGDGALDLVFVDQWFSNVEAAWEFEPLANLLTKLTSFARVIVFDKRGTGLSDPVALTSLPTIEGWGDDLLAVLDAAGSGRAALMSGVGSSAVSLVFAASHPGRTSALVLVDPYARVSQAPDYPIGVPTDQVPQHLERLRANWGLPGGGTMAFLAPDLLADQALAESYARYERQSGSPGAARAMIAALYASDVRDVLPAIRVPTLVLCHRDAPRIRPAHGRYIADRVPGARYVEIPGTTNYIWAGEPQSLISQVQEFLTGSRPEVEPDRVLATILFTDIVGSTAHAARLGDAGWRRLLLDHDRDVRSALQRFRGREVKTTGDGFLATFDGPARAVRCAVAIHDALAAQGIAVRAGIHTGEIELLENDIAGIAVHIASRICALAQPGETLVSSTVRDLVIGSGLEFEARGGHALKGVPGEWPLFALTSPASQVSGA